MPRAWVEEMYATYQRLKSLRATGKLYGRSNQAIHEIFRRKGFEMRRKLHAPVIYKGKKYTPTKDGALRRTDGREGKHRGTLLHHVVWEEHNGPIPAGHQVSFKNGDKTDCRIENLFCLSTAEMTRRNATGENQFTKVLAEKRVEQNTGFIIQQAQRWHLGYGVPLEDLIQEGRIAVVKASKGFDPRQGFKFLTYAAFHIRQRMQRFAEDYSKVVRVPNGKFKSAGISCVAIDAPVGEDGENTLGDLILRTEETTTGEVDAAMRSERLRKAVKRLPKQMRKVLEARFWGGESLRQIAERFGLSGERIRQIEVMALRKLRKSRILKGAR